MKCPKCGHEFDEDVEKIPLARDKLKTTTKPNEHAVKVSIYDA